MVAYEVQGVCQGAICHTFHESMCLCRYGTRVVILSCRRYMVMQLKLLGVTETGIGAADLKVKCMTCGRTKQGFTNVSCCQTSYV